MSARQGRRAAGTLASSRGVCPVCRGTVRLRVKDGKVAVHGVNAANPRGCAGRDEPPMRVQRQQPSEPAPIRPALAHDASEPPALDIEVRVERRDDAPVRMRSARPGPDDAA